MFQPCSFQALTNPSTTTNTHEPPSPLCLSWCPVLRSPVHHTLLPEVAHKKQHGKIKTTYTTTTHATLKELVPGERQPSAPEVKEWVAWRAEHPWPVLLRDLPTYRPPGDTATSAPASTANTHPPVGQNPPTTTITTNSGGRKISLEFEGDSLPPREELGSTTAALRRLQF